MRYGSLTIVLCLAWMLTSSAAWPVQEQPSNGDAAQAPNLDSLQQIEKQCEELAKRLRSQSSVLPKEQQLLTELVEIAFRQRQSLFSQELSENQRRLEKLSQLHAEREKSRTQIVQRRVEELLNPNIDWLRNDSAPLQEGQVAEQKGEPVAVPNQNFDRGANEIVADTTATTSTLPGEFPSLNSPGRTSDLLRNSPGQLRDLLIEKARGAKEARDDVASVRAQIPLLGKDAVDQAKLRVLQDNLKIYEGNWKYYKGQFEFAKLQYDEIIKYLKTAVAMIEIQLAMAEEKSAAVQQLYNTGRVTKLEQMTASVRPAELKIELQRVQSLLKLYRAAEDDPELSDMMRPVSKLNFTVTGAGLGEPKWIDGKGGVTTNTFGMSIHLDLKGTADTARILFAKIPEHENTQLIMKFDVADAQSKVWERVGTSWNAIIDVKLSAEDLQIALTGQPLGKAYVLKPDLTMLEAANDGSIDHIRDTVIATIEIAKTNL